jgi:hypothetical protein
MTTTTADPTTLTDLRALLTAMHAAGWRHSGRRHEGDRDWETGAYENEGYTLHRWTRRLATIEVWVSVDSGQPIGAIVFDPDSDDDSARFGADPHLQVGVGWVARRGVSALHRIAEAAGLLEVAHPRRPLRL